MKKIVRKVAALMIAAAVGITSPAIIYAEGTIGTVQTEDNQSEDSTEIDNSENKDTTEKDVTDKNTENPADTEEKTDDSEQTDVTDKDSNVENPDGSDTQDEIKPDDTDESQNTENPDAEEPAEEKELDATYEVHMQNIGWMDARTNGETAGNDEGTNHMEAIRIQVPQDEEQKLTGSIVYRAHVSDIGWQENVFTGEVAGTTGRNKNMEAFKMWLSNMSGESYGDDYKGGIEYRAHVSDVGWQNWVSDNEVAGTTGQGKKMEALQIRLTGEMQKYCDIYYRAHVANFGWLGWAKNGEIAGTTGYSYGLQAIQVVVVPKGKAAPGSTADHYREKKFTEMELRANLYSSSTPYLLLVNRSRHKVYIFQGYRGNWKQIREWSCSDGAASTPTVEGTFKVQNRGYYFDSGSARCYWWTQFYGNYLFHSVLYHKDGTLMDGRVGMALSHGCVRLEIQNAKWIYDTIPSGSTVVVYH